MGQVHGCGGGESHFKITTGGAQVKLIVAIKPSGKSLRRLLRHVYLPLGRSGREVDPIGDDPASRVVAKLNGSIGAMTMKPVDDAHALAGDIDGRSQYRHVVLSCADTGEPVERKNSFCALMAMAGHWIKNFVPGGRFLGIAHDDRQHPHLHLIIRNEGNDGRCLSWSKSDVKTMQSLTWVPLELMTAFDISPGRGAGINPPEYSKAPYPLAKNLDAKFIASLTQEKIHEYTKSKQLQVGRVDKQGHITSVIYNGRRIRLSTIKGLAKATQEQQGATRPANLRRMGRGNGKNHSHPLSRPSPHPAL
jgi:hypothetical protein